METKATKIRWAIDQEGTWLHVLVDDGTNARRYAEANRDKPQRLRLTHWSEKRSLSANAYAWKLLNDLAAVLKLSPIQIYRELIPNVGGNSTAASVPLNSLDTLRKSWENNGSGWLIDVIGISDIPGNVDVMMYYGSSVYDTPQMARLIDLIIDECREQGVEYLPPDKLSAMMEAWDEKQKNESS